MFVMMLIPVLDSLTVGFRGKSSGLGVRRPGFAIWIVLCLGAIFLNFLSLSFLFLKWGNVS